MYNTRQILSMTIYDRPFCLKEQIAFGTGTEVCYLINCIVDASELVFIVPYLAQLLLGFGSTVRAVCFCVSTVFGISQIICFDRDNGWSSSFDSHDVSRSVNQSRGGSDVKVSVLLNIIVCKAWYSQSRGGSLASYIDTQNAFPSVHSAASQLPLT
jgi:hypothetical protein